MTKMNLRIKKEAKVYTPKDIKKSIAKPKSEKKEAKEAKIKKIVQNAKDNVVTQQYSIQPPPTGLAYIPASMFNMIVNSFEKEIDKFKNSFDNFIKINNIMCNNNALDWLETDRFIHDYIKQLMVDRKLDKFIIEYEMIDAMHLLIEYYKTYLYKDVFENEMEIIHYIKNNYETKYYMAYCIIKKLVGHKTYETVMGF